MEFKYYFTNQGGIEAFRDLIPEDLYKAKGMHYIAAVDENDIASGILIWERLGSVVELRHMAVFPQVRELGVATGLLQTLMGLLSEKYPGAVTQVTYPASDEYFLFHLFMKSQKDFFVMETEKLYLIDKDKRNKEPFYKELKKINSRTYSFLEVSPNIRKKYYHNLSEHNINFFNPSEESDLIFELSRCVLRDDKITASVLVRETPFGELEIAFIESNPHHGKDLAACLSSCIQKADEIYPEKRVAISAINEQSVKLAKKLFGKTIRDISVCTAISFGNIDLMLKEA